jgi:spore germination protein
MLKYKSTHKIIALYLLIILILPSLILFSSPMVSASDTIQNSNNSWIKAVLMIVISFLINNFTNTDNSNNKDDESQVGDKPSIDNKLDNEQKEVLGFYVNWFSTSAYSYDSLKEYWPNIDILAPFWYTANPDSSIESRYGGHQYEVSSLTKNRNIKILPLINNNQQNNMILTDPDIRSKTINNIVNLINKYDYNGVNIDFEFIPSWTRNSYTAFIKELSEKLHRENKILTISVFPKIDVPIELQGAYDYSALAPYIDRMVIMTYDHHWSTSTAGPIAPIDWVEKNISYTIEYLPADKILLGIANYGYDWPDTGLSRDISSKEAIKIANEKGAELQWDTKSQSPYFYYWDNEGQKHEVWFENSYSLEFKLNLVNKYNLQGIAIWRLGNETERFWKIIEEKLR